MEQHSFWFDGVAFFGIILVRYFFVAGCFHWLLKALAARSRTTRTPDQQQLSNESVRHDIQLSVISAGVFALATAGIMSLHAMGLTRLYSQPQEYGLAYLAFSYIAVLILQDAYFYATHRLVHHQALFPWFHQGHHRSRQPTPWTSFAFDPLEAIVQALFLIAVVVLIPLHFITLLAVLTTMTIWAVVNHLGLDHLPLRFPHHWLGRWVIGPAHHSVHHRRYAKNFGLYFTFWDRVFGTEDPAYATSLKQPSA
jgi:sterol desaturase/sphingolipid hydroxylase (fatty acid hydroxylase superfamily)